MSNIKKSALLLFFLFVGFGDILGQVLKTDISVHDPVMIRQDSTYYIFCTGWGVSVWSSKDMLHWKQEKPVFDHPPQWTVDSVKGFKGHIWAPDISSYNGLYYLYYAVSVFGKNTSCIGLATNKTLNPGDPRFKWEDHGMIIQSYPGKDNWNAIDPNLITDKDGTPYLAFGSFWDGIKIVRLTTDRMKVDQSLSNIPTIASRRRKLTEIENDSIGNHKRGEAGNNAIEAPFIFRKGRYFYLFASIDYCCRGPKSTYKMIIGRSKKLLGPYKDADGVPLRYGGGTILLAGDKAWYGVGHNAVCDFAGKDYLIFHGYDAADQGKSKLRIEKLNWRGGWPELAVK